MSKEQFSFWSRNYNGAKRVCNYMRRIVQAVYDGLIRPFLPRKIAVFNGVAIREPKLFDTFDHDPNYKSDLISAVRIEVADGDDVTVIGAGHGISAISAARRAGPNGHVRIYEAAEDWIQKLQSTMALNDIPKNQYTIRHALVGPAVDVDGDVAKADTIAVNDLNLGDVLEMDCEGAELEILKELGDAEPPRTIIVETHPSKGSKTPLVRDVLNNLGYHVQKVGEDERDGDILVGKLNAT